MIKSISYVFSFDLVSKALLSFSTLAIIRFLSIEQYAAYTLSLSIVTVLTQTLVSSFNRIYIVGQDRFDIAAYAGPFLGLQFFLVVMATVVIYPFTSFGSKLYIALVLLLFSCCASDFLKTVYQKSLRFNRFSQVELIRSVFYVGLLLVFIAVYRARIMAWHCFLIQSFALLAVTLPLLIRRNILRGMGHLTVGARIAKKIILSEYRFLFGYFFVLAFFSQLDVFMLKLLSHEGALATYGSAFRYYSVLLMTLNSVHTVLLPLIQDVSYKNELERICKKCQNLTMCFAPIVLIGAWCSQWLIPWIDGGKYPDAITVFQILSISSIFSLAFSPHVNFIMRFERFLFLFVLICVAILVNLILNSALIPSFGAVGAAWATLISFLLINGVIFIYSRKMIAIFPDELPVRL